MKAINVQNLCREYRIPSVRQGMKGIFLDLFRRQHKIIKAVDNVSFAINRGEIVGYIGPNGAGKTTTVKLLSGILSPTSGHIEVLGLDPFKNRQKHSLNLGMMMGNQTRLFWNLPVSESYELFGRLFEIESNVLQERVKGFSEVLGIKHLLSKQVRTLSLGERTRCELLLVVIHLPPILILDEPTIGMDVAIKHRIRDFLKNLRDKHNITIILTSHDVSDIEALATRIIVIDKGHKIFDDSPEAFKIAFGLDMRTIEIEFSNPIDNRMIKKIQQDFHDIQDIKKQNFLLSFQTKKGAPIYDILTTCSKFAEIKEIRILEEMIDNIVRRIYEKHSKN